MKKNWKYTLQNRQRIHKAKNLLFLLPSLAGVTFFVMVPFLKVVLSSFFAALSGEFVGVRNYIAVFQNTAFHLAIGNTVRFMAAGIPLLLVISLGFALKINSNPKYERYKYLYLLPMAIPAATMVLVWKLLFSEQGFLNKALRTHTDFLGEGSAFFILVGSYLWKNLGYTIVLWLAGLKSIPKEIMDAAEVDGAGKVQRFFRVKLPCLKGSMFTILIVSILNSFKIFREVYLVGGAYPQRSIYLIQNVFNNWYTNLEQDKLAAGVVLLVVVLGTVSFLLQRQWDREDA